MLENEIAKTVVDACFQIHRQLGPGLFESVYEEVLCYELEDLGLSISRQKSIPVFWKDLKLDQGFRADIVVNDKVIIEIKAIELLKRVHYKQLMTYLKLTDLKLGLLINFNEALIKNGIHRIVNDL